MVSTWPCALEIPTPGARGPTLAQTALQEFAQHATPLHRLYLPVFQAQIQQSRGDLEGALESYRQGVLQLGRAGQDSAAGDGLQSFAQFAGLVGNTASVLSFARQQKLHARNCRGLLCSK
jgi:hypothetical protein